MIGNGWLLYSQFPTLTVTWMAIPAFTENGVISMGIEIDLL